MPIIHISRPLKMKTIHLKKNGKAKQLKMTAFEKKLHDRWKKKYDAIEALRNDVMELCELYWDNSGMLDDEPMDKFIEKIHDLVRR